MRVSRLCVSVAAAAGFSLCTAAHAGFVLLTSQATARASSSLSGVGMDPENMAGSDFFTFLMLDESFDGSTLFDGSNSTTAHATVQAFIDQDEGTISGGGAAVSEVTAADATAGLASALSALTINFSIVTAQGWTIDAFARSTRADVEVSLVMFGDHPTIFSTGDAGSPTSGVLEPGEYQIHAFVSAFSDLDLSDGLFTDGAYHFTLGLGPIPAPSAGAALCALGLFAARRRRV